MESNKTREVTIISSAKNYCHNCIYRVTAGCESVCDYLVQTGRQRGCAAGIGCTRKVVAKRKKKAAKLCKA